MSADSVSTLETRTNRGVTTLYKGAYQVARIKKGKVSVSKGMRIPIWSRIKIVDYVDGKTLSRLHVIERQKNTIRVIIKTLSHKQMTMQCDACMRSHAPHNKRCSATLGIISAASAPGVLYTWGSLAPAGRWKQTVVNIATRHKVGVATYVRQ